MMPQELSLNRSVSSSHLVGTWSYIAPEAIRGETIDARADLYALGMILYRTLTRTSPFVGLTPRQILLAHLQGIKTSPREIVPKIPRALNNLVMRLLSPRVEDRPRDAAEVIHDLGDLLGELTPSETLDTGLAYVRSGKLVGRRSVWEPLVKRLNALGKKASTPKKDSDLSEKEDLGSWAAPILFTGEAGVGKRRMVREVERYCQLHGTPFLEVPAYLDQRPLQTVTAILSGLVNLVTELKPDAETTKEIKTLKKWLADEQVESVSKPEETLSPDLEGPNFGLEEIRGTSTRKITRAFEVLSLYLESLCNLIPERKLVLYIPIQVSASFPDEKGGRDPLGLFQHLSRSISASSLKDRLLFLATSENSQVTPVLKRFVPYSLSPLSKEDTQLLLESMLGEDQLPEGLLDIVFKISSGNPLHVEESMRGLIADGHLARQEGRWRLRDTSPETLAKLAVPEKINQTIGRRFSNLSEDLQGILRIVAILSGNLRTTIQAAEVNTILKKQLPKTLGLLNHAVQIGWLKSLPNYAFEFSSSSFSPVILKHLEEKTREALHKKTAEYLEGTLTADVFELAYHYDRAGLTQKSIHYNIDAGMEASAQYAPQQALKHFERAKKMLGKLSSEKKKKDFYIKQSWLIDEQIARLLSVIGEPQKSQTAYEELVERFSTLTKSEFPGTRARARMKRRLGHIYRGLGQNEKALGCYEEALRLLGHEAEGREGALLLVQMAGVKGRLGRRPQARQDCRYALARIQAQEAPVIFATCYTVLGELELTGGYLELAHEYFNRALKTYERLEDREGIAMTLSYLGTVLDRMGSNEEAELKLRRAVREAQAIGEVKRVALARNNLGNLRFRRGDYPNSAREYLAGVEAARRLGDRRLLATSLNNLGNVSRQRGAYGQALEYYSESLELKSDLKDPRSLCHTYIAMGELEIYIDDIKNAYHHMQKALQLARESSAIDLEAQTIFDLGIIARAQEDYETMYERFQQAYDLFVSTNNLMGEMNVSLERSRSQILLNENIQDCLKSLNRVLAFTIEKGDGGFRSSNLSLTVGG